MTFLYLIGSNMFMTILSINLFSKSNYTQEKDGMEQLKKPKNYAKPSSYVSNYLVRSASLMTVMN